AVPGTGTGWCTVRARGNGTGTATTAASWRSATSRAARRSSPVAHLPVGCQVPVAAPPAPVGLDELAGAPDAQRGRVGGQLVRPPAGLPGARPVPLPLLVGDAHAALRGGRPNRS